MRQRVQPQNESLILLVTSPGFFEPVQEDKAPANQDQGEYHPDHGKAQVNALVQGDACRRQGDPERQDKREQPRRVKIERGHSREQQNHEDWPGVRKLNNRDQQITTQ